MFSLIVGQIAFLHIVGNSIFGFLGVLPMAPWGESAKTDRQLSKLVFSSSESMVDSTSIVARTPSTNGGRRLPPSSMEIGDHK